MNFSPLATLEVVILTTSGASDENFVKIITFLFQHSIDAPMRLLAGLQLGHRTMVCTVCLIMFLLASACIVFQIYFVSSEHEYILVIRMSWAVVMFL